MFNIMLMGKLVSNFVPNWHDYYNHESFYRDYNNIKTMSLKRE